MADIVETILEREPEEIDFSVDGQAAWSMSKQKTLNNCPFNYYLQYIIKLKLKPFEPSLVTEVGKAAHLILENILLGKNLKDSYSLAREKFRDVLGDEDWDKHVATLEMSIMSFQDRLKKFEENNPIKRIIQEQRLGITRNYEPAGFFGDDVFFRGVIDLGLQTESNDVIIIDHKTGAPAHIGIRNFQSQLDLYKVMFHFGIQKVEGAQAGIHFVRDGQIQLGEYSPKEEIEGKLVHELEHSLTGSIDRVKEIGFFKHKRGNYCNWCQYNEPCKKGELLDIEKKTVKFFKKKEIINDV
jgi:RecB family exonuclease